MKLEYPACFYPCEQIHGGFTVIIPDLPGSVTQGKDLSDAMFMIKDAAIGWVKDELEEGRAVPRPSELKDVKSDEHAVEFVRMITA